MHASNSIFSLFAAAVLLQAINQGEVMHGEIARSRASSSEVRAFAEMMVTDHTRVLSRANITPMDNQLSRTLQTGADQTAAALRSMSGAEFDRAYMRTQVEMRDRASRRIWSAPGRLRAACSSPPDHT